MISLEEGICEKVQSDMYHVAVLCLLQQYMFTGKG